jgi:hypothetical protein
MTEFFVQRISRHHWPDDAGPEVDAAFREGLPRNAARRMSRLALMCARVLRDMPYDPETAVVYASGMSEARNLEDYLDSFPEPSPTRFQASVHPAGAQQALIALERPIREFYPLVGDANLFDQALQTAALAESNDVILVAGEEKGTWLLDLGLAEARSFAFALHLSRGNEGARAIVQRRENPTEAVPLKLAQVFDRLGERTDWAIPAIASGSWEWQWL